MNQHEAENSEPIKTEKINETNNDENSAHTELLLTESKNKEQANDKAEDFTYNMAAISDAKLSMESENTAVMSPFPVMASKPIGTKCDFETTTSHDKSALSLIEISSATTTVATTTAATAAEMSHLQHVASAPILATAQLRANQQQQQKIKSYHDAKQTALWDTRSSTSAGSTILKGGGICSVSGTPKMTRKSSESTNLDILPRRVSFPKSDNELVTGYLEPANPWEHVSTVKSVVEIVDLYIKSCKKHNTKPLKDILEHLKVVELNNVLRQPLLSLKETKLLPEDCEALEEILKRVQYKCIDLSSCELEESAISALFDIIEYYEAANELNISSNPRGLTTRGWSSCAYMVGRSQALQVLNAEGNPISKSSAECLGNALCTSNLHTVKLEHCGLKGQPLSGLCMKIRHNRILKELWLAHNDLDSRDAESIAELLKYNHFLELVDISNNNIGDEGLKHIVEALIVQSKELERRSMFQRAAAIEDDIFSPVDLAPNEEPFRTENIDESRKINEEIEDDNKVNEDKNAFALIPGLEDFNINVGIINSESSPLTTVDDDMEPEDDTEDTVKSNIIKSKQHAVSVTANSGSGSGCGGQSMLDKLLSMNSDSSSEEGASIISTDTIVACGSEDASFLSDDIYDLVTKTAVTKNSENLKEDLTAAAQNKNREMLISNESIMLSLESPLQLCKTEEHTSAGCAEKILSCDTCTLEANNHCKCDDNNVAVVISSGGGGDIGNERISLPMPIQSINTTAVDCRNANNNIINNNNTNNINNNNNRNIVQSQEEEEEEEQQQKNETTANSSTNSTVFEVTANDSDCLVPCTSHNKTQNVVILQGASSAAVDVNRNSRLTEDYDDTHSTDSAFESASEGDISRHLTEEFSRFSTSHENARLSEINRELAIETATIASESTECLLEETLGITPKEPLAKIGTQKSDEIKTKENNEVRFAEPLHSTLPNETSQRSNTEFECTTLLPKVTVESESVRFVKINEDNSPIPTPPPPSTSPGGAGLSMRRTDSSCNFMTQSMRNHSQSSDSLCSDNSLDGSVSSDLNISSSNERLTKNDTLTRQFRQFETPIETVARSPGGLKALAVWNNNLTKEAGLYISDLLMDTSSLELLNIGKNILSNDFISRIKESLTKNTTLTTLGLQSAHLSAQGIDTLAAILSFGGNSTLQRIDIRDNKLEADCLSTLSEALKSNTTVTQIDIDDEPKRLSVGSDAHLQYTRVVENVRSMCSRNEKTQAQLQAEKTANAGGASKRRSGYYVGSRKISLTCHSRPLIDYSVASAVAMPPPVNKLEVKRKSGVRLRSPVPSPPTVSPSSSPNRSRFQVFRVTEVSPLTSPLAQTPPPVVHTAITACNSMPIPTPLSSSVDRQQRLASSISLTTSTSLPTMATAKSSTQTIKRPSSSRSSRFHVSKIYEDPKVPLEKRSLPPITPPIHLPPSPMLKSANQCDAAFEDKPNEKDNNNIVSSHNSSTLSALSNESYIDAKSTELATRVQSVRCPIAVFNENDITLTHDSANEVRTIAAAAAAASATTKNVNNQKTSLNVAAIEDEHDIADAITTNTLDLNTTATQQVARKMSCPTAVDKLLTLFNPVTIFQRSTSPELQKQQHTISDAAESTNTTTTAIPTTAQNSVISTLKQSPPTWSKLGSDILNLSVGETEKTLTIEQPRSFLDAASKQLRDFGKQVFRQNLTVASTMPITTNEEVGAIEENAQNTIEESVQPAITKSSEKENNTIKNLSGKNDFAKTDAKNVSESKNFNIPSTDKETSKNF